MSLLFAYFPDNQECLSDQLVERIAADCTWPRDRVLMNTSEKFAMLCVQRDTVARSGVPRLRYGDVGLLYCGRLDNREHLASALGVPADRDDEEFVVAAYRKYGPKFASYLLGDFAIVLRDNEIGATILARDPVGAIPLYRTRIGDALLVSTGIAAMRPVPGIDLTWNEKWVADTLALVKVDAAQTAYKAIHAVRPGHVEVFRNGEEESSSFWTLPTYDEVSRIDGEEAVREFARLFDQAVACRLRGAGPLATELSAGLDSTAIAESAVRLLKGSGRTLHAFTHALPESIDSEAGGKGDDREEVSGLLAQWPEIEHHWITSPTDSLVSVLGRSLSRHGAPPRNDLNTIGEQLPETMRQHDLRVLLSGFGGDQLVTWHGAGHLEAFVEERDWSALYSFLSCNGRLRGAIHTLRFAAGFGVKRLQRQAIERVRDQAKELASIGDAQFLARHGYVERQQDRPLVGTMREREAMLIARPHIAYRLQDSAIGAFARGFVYRYPMLDTRLMEFAHNLPARFKRTPTQNRCMIREAKKGLLPDSIRLRDKVGGSTVPVAKVVFTRFAGELADLIERNLHDPRLKGKIAAETAVANLRETQVSGQWVDTVAMKQVLLLAMLALWTEAEPWHRSSEDRVGQVNQRE